MAWVDQKNGLVADTVYCDNELVAKDVAFKLPEITFATAESQAMGAMETPLIGLVEAMEATFTKIGTDLGLVKASTPESTTTKSATSRTTYPATAHLHPWGVRRL